MMASWLLLNVLFLLFETETNNDCVLFFLFQIPSLSFQFLKDI